MTCSWFESHYCSSSVRACHSDTVGVHRAVCRLSGWSFSTVGVTHQPHYSSCLPTNKQLLHQLSAICYFCFLFTQGRCLIEFFHFSLISSCIKECIILDAENHDLKSLWDFTVLNMLCFSLLVQGLLLWLYRLYIRASRRNAKTWAFSTWCQKRFFGSGSNHWMGLVVPVLLKSSSVILQHVIIFSIWQMFFGKSVPLMQLFRTERQSSIVQIRRRTCFIIKLSRKNKASGCCLYMDSKENVVLTVTLKANQKPRIWTVSSLQVSLKVAHT